MVFEHASTALWTAESLCPNNYVIYLERRWLYAVNHFLRNDVFFSNSMLLENSAVDLQHNTENVSNFKFYTYDQILLFYIYYLFSLKVRLTVLVPYDNTKSAKIASLDKIYKSSSWLEREVGEMFKISYLGKNDNRRLLLDYSKSENPLLKNYSVHGLENLSYNFFEDQVSYCGRR